MRHGIDSSSPAYFDSDTQGATIDAKAYWQAWFDGAALPNPGKIGIGIVLVAPDGSRAEKFALTGRSGCSNEAELQALCAALDMASAAGAQRLQLRGDSDVAIRYVRGPESTQIARLLVLVAEARQRLLNFEDVQLIRVPRHRNAEADRLSRQALGLPVVAAKGAKRGRRSR